MSRLEPRGAQRTDLAEVPAPAAAAPRRWLTLAARDLADLLLLASGAYAPLTGFMDAEDHARVCSTMRLADDSPWPLPITLAVRPALAQQLEAGERLGLTKGRQSQPLAVLEVSGVYRIQLRATAQAVFGTQDPAHPGAAQLLEGSPYRLAGPVRLLEPLRPHVTPELDLPATPAATRRLLAQRGWQTVVGFQTRNPLHRAHEYIMKTALETVDGLLLHPLVGPTKKGDWSAAIRLQVYQAVLQHYFPPERVLMGIFPAAMRYAGPREALFHALVRRNYGCSHFIVGRDHAGVGDYYRPFAAHEVFAAFTERELGIRPLFFDHAFFCRRCGGMATQKTCPHDDEQRLAPSGTRVRQLLKSGDEVPQELSRPEVTAILRAMSQ